MVAFTPCWYLSIRPTKKREKEGEEGGRGEEEEGKKKIGWDKKEACAP